VHRHSGDVGTTHFDLPGVYPGPDLDTEGANGLDDRLGQSIATLGLVNVATNPSPAVLTSRPENRRSC
jgi:hypothetical protein